MTLVKILAVREVASSKRIYAEGSLACRLATVGSYFLGKLKLRVPLVEFWPSRSRNKPTYFRIDIYAGSYNN